jgi:hypothetical protein
VDALDREDSPADVDAGAAAPLERVAARVLLLLLLPAAAPDDEAPALDRVVRVDARVLVEVLAEPLVAAALAGGTGGCAGALLLLLLLLPAHVLALFALVVKGCGRTTRG